MNLAPVTIILRNFCPGQIYMGENLVSVSVPVFQRIDMIQKEKEEDWSQVVHEQVPSCIHTLTSGGSCLQIYGKKGSEVMPEECCLPWATEE